MIAYWRVRSVDKAVTFNSAGLHEATIDALKEKNETTEAALARINRITTSYIGRGDFLNFMQDLLSFSMPTTLGKRVVVEGGGAHGIAAMVDAFHN